MIPLLGATAFVVLPFSAANADGLWRVARVTGHAWVATQAGPSDLAAGMVLQPAQTLSTAQASRVMLVRGTESMMVGPNSMVALSEKPEEGLSTTILEKTGSVQFDVERRNVQHFSVETPVLAAVVKGTHFTVTVTKATGSVAVDRGQVQVTALATGQSTDITPGLRATVGSRGLSVSGPGRRPGIVNGLPRSPVVTPFSALSPRVGFTTAELSAAASVASVAAQVNSVATAAPTSSPGSANGSYAQVASQRNYQPGALAALAGAIGNMTSRSSAPAANPSGHANAGHASRSASTTIGGPSVSSRPSGADGHLGGWPGHAHGWNWSGHLGEGENGRGRGGGHGFGFGHGR